MVTGTWLGTAKVSLGPLPLLPMYHLCMYHF
jgi:hypothetical protein